MLFATENAIGLQPVRLASEGAARCTPALSLFSEANKLRGDEDEREVIYVREKLDGDVLPAKVAP
jgi:hypothetical protein